MMPSWFPDEEVQNVSYHRQSKSCRPSSILLLLLELLPSLMKSKITSVTIEICSWVKWNWTLWSWTEATETGWLVVAVIGRRSYQCPPYSCQIPVIPVDSSGIPVEFTSQNFTQAMKLCNSGIYTRMVPRVWSPEWHWNPVTGIELKMPNMENVTFSQEK